MDANTKMNIIIVISSLFTIIAISAGLFATYKAFAWSAKKDEELKIELDKIDLEFHANMARINTAAAFIKAGYHVPVGEKIVSLGDGYIVSVKSSGEQVVTLAPNNCRH